MHLSKMSGESSSRPIIPVRHFSMSPEVGSPGLRSPETCFRQFLGDHHTCANRGLNHASDLLFTLGPKTGHRFPLLVVDLHIGEPLDDCFNTLTKAWAGQDRSALVRCPSTLLTPMLRLAVLEPFQGFGVRGKQIKFGEDTRGMESRRREHLSEPDSPEYVASRILFALESGQAEVFMYDAQ
jgi:hypothetical protein